MIILYLGLTGLGGYIALQGNSCSSASLEQALMDRSDITPDTSTCFAVAAKHTIESLDLTALTDCSSAVLEICFANVSYWAETPWPNMTKNCAAMIPADPPIPCSGCAAVDACTPCNVKTDFEEGLGHGGPACTAATASEIFTARCQANIDDPDAALGIELTQKIFQKEACEGCAAHLATCRGCESTNPQ